MSTPPPKKSKLNAFLIGLVVVAIPVYGLAIFTDKTRVEQPSVAESVVAPQSVAVNPPIESDARPLSNVRSISQAPPASSAPPTTTSDDAALLLGNPSQAAPDADPNNRLVQRPQFDLSYHQDNGHANWVAWHLQADDLGRTGRGKFRPDPLLPTDAQIRPNDYRGSGYDRGHLCPSGDRTSTRENNDATFVMSNMLPQTAELNQRVWAKLENYCRAQARAGNELYIVSGGAGTQGRIAGGKVNVPASCWKVILVLPQGDNDLARINAQTRVIAVAMPNQATPEVGGARWASYIITAGEVEAATGYKFFTNLPEATRQALLAKRDSGRGSRGKSEANDARTERNGERNTIVARAAPQPRVNTSTEVAAPSAPEVQPLPRERAPDVMPRAPAADPETGSEQAGDVRVWVNTRSGIYRYPGQRWYGTTQEGEYMSESEAISRGYRATRNGQ